MACPLDPLRCLNAAVAVRQLIRLRISVMLYVALSIVAVPSIRH